MSHPRTTTRILVTAGAAAALATPALGADAAGTPEADALRVTAPGSPATLAVREAALAHKRLERAAERRQDRRVGPFVPVAGKVDYGTTANAFGAARSGHVHSGHDMFAPAGTPLVAVSEGVVAEAGSDGGQGNYVYLYDPAEKLTFVYMHLAEPSPLEAGDRVAAGELVGALGCTGSCSGDHLHFEIREGKGYAGEARDPLPELERWESLAKPL